MNSASKGSNSGLEPPGDLDSGESEEGEGMGCLVGVWAWLGGLLAPFGGGVMLLSGTASKRPWRTVAKRSWDMYLSCFCLRLPAPNTLHEMPKACCHICVQPGTALSHQWPPENTTLKVLCPHMHASCCYIMYRDTARQSPRSVTARPSCFPGDSAMTLD